MHISRKNNDGKNESLVPPFDMKFHHLAIFHMPKVKKKIMDATKGRRPTPKMPPQTQKMTQQGHGNLERRSRETTATNFGNATHSATYDRLCREKQDHVFQTLRRHNFLMAPVEKLPPGNRYLLAKTFRK